jgi:hypothetical protein
MALFPYLFENIGFGGEFEEDMRSDRLGPLRAILLP